jgi:hypothetical protein
MEVRVNNETVDAERLAALLDGTLPANERARVFELLARSPAELDVLAEAAAIQADLGEHVSPARTRFRRPSLRPKRQFRMRAAIQRRAALWLWAPVAAAAMLAAVLLLPIASGRGNGQMALALLDGGTLVVADGDGSLEAALGPEWTDVGWSVVRGSGGLGAESGHAFRIGARIADYEVAARARDLEALAPVSGELQELLSGVSAGSAHALTYERLTERAVLGADPGSFERDRAVAASAVHELLDASPWLELGVWVEQARIATLASRSDFFARTEALRALGLVTERLGRGAASDPVIAERLGELRAVTAAGVSADELPRVRELLDEVVRRAAK